MLGARATAYLLATPFVLAACLASCGTASPAGAGGGTGAAAATGTGAGVSFVSGVGSAMQTCGDGGTLGASTGCEGLEGGVSYMNEVAHIFANCQGEACHGSPSRATTVGIPAYECCDGRPLIVPGNATGSYLVDKIEGHDLCLGARMPLNLPPLSASDILTIKRWVCEGAPDN